MIREPLLRARSTASDAGMADVSELFGTEDPNAASSLFGGGGATAPDIFAGPNENVPVASAKEEESPWTTGYTPEGFQCKHVHAEP